MRTIIYLVLSVILVTSCKSDKRFLVVSKIRQAAKLATTETTIDKVVFGTSNKKLLRFIHLKDAHFAAYSTAFIKSGVDLNKMKSSDILIDDKRIEIELPHVEVLNFSYPFKYFKIDESITENTLMNKIDIYDQENFYRLAELDIRNNLKYTGIKESTEQKTRLLLEGLLKNLGYEEIYISFKKEGELIPEVELTEGEIN